METEKEASDLLNEYIEWMKDNTVLRTISSGWTEINTPFMDRHNDGIQIYIRKVGDDIELTDDGYTFSDLKMSGCDLKTDRQISLLNKILNSGGIRMNEDVLSLTVHPKEFPARKLEFITAIQQIGDLYVTSRSNTYSFFSDEVALWFESNNRYPLRNYSTTGRNGVRYDIDFIFPKKDRHSSETALQAIGDPNKHIVSYHALMKREIDRKMDVYLMVQDTDLSDRKFKEVRNIAKTGDVEIIRWSEKDDHADIFA